MARVDTANGPPGPRPDEPDYRYSMDALADCTPEELAKMGAATAGKRPPTTR
ncbi:hypothetical protein [Glutamicibacter nicotianae]|uniref:hypothetical protein n=1 Tax=Glutamicibacter nicotianae TaxID=37929 RepID=UPI001CBE335E|nr:hypothetical protein [Glutamicibacter nicotianae]